MSREIDLNLLLVLDAVMAERNLRRAGERLGRSQPAVSQAVARLRDVTGDRLFDRTPAGVAPTARAERLWAEIRDPLARLRAAMGATAFDPATATGEAAIGLSDDARILFWPAIARAIHAGAPGLTLRAVSTDHARVLDDLSGGHLDLAVTVAGQPPPGLGAAILLRDDFVLLHPADAPPPRTARAYAAAPQLAFVFGEERPAHADEALAAMGEGRRVVARVDRFDAVPDMVRTLGAVVALPSRIAARFARTPGVALAALPVPFPPAVTKLCWSQKHRNDALNAWLRERTGAAVAGTLDAPPDA